MKVINNILTGLIVVIVLLGLTGIILNLTDPGIQDQIFESVPVLLSAVIIGMLILHTTLKKSRRK